jgi:hypothetical protein
LQIRPLENNLLDFQILDGFADDKEANILFRVKVSRRQLISEFVRKFELFLQVITSLISGSLVSTCD